MFFKVSCLILLKFLFGLKVVNCECMIWVLFIFDNFFERFMNLILFLYGVRDLIKLYRCFIFLFNVMIMNGFFFECNIFLNKDFIFFFNWFFLMFVIFFKIVLLKIMGWLLILNVEEFGIIIGCVLVIDMYIFLVVDVFLDFYCFIK